VTKEDVERNKGDTQDLEFWKMVVASAQGIGGGGKKKPVEGRKLH